MVQYRKRAKDQGLSRVSLHSALRRPRDQHRRRRSRYRKVSTAKDFVSSDCARSRFGAPASSKAAAPTTPAVASNKKHPSNRKGAGFLFCLPFGRCINLPTARPTRSSQQAQAPEAGEPQKQENSLCSVEKEPRTDSPASLSTGTYELEEGIQQYFSNTSSKCNTDVINRVEKQDMLVMPAQVQQYNAGHHLRVQQPQDRTYVGPTSQQSPHACHTQQPYMDVGPNGRRFLGEYELLETLGKGMSGKVKKACHVQTGEYVALKVIDKSKAVKRTLSQLHTEIVALKSLNHPNILQLHYVELDAMYPKKDGTLMPAIVLALQIAEGGELFDFMMYTGHFNEIVSRTLFRQLLSALLFCHERNIYHRDIKPENLLLDDKYQLKIADFGLAAIRQTPEELLRTECGTRSYMAPEILAHREYEGGKADVWSSGVVLFILLAGNPPFQLAKKGDWWFNAVMDGDYDRFWRAHKKYAPHFPPGAQAFLSTIFQADPQLRPSSAEIMKHEWVRGPTLTAAALYREMASRKGEVELEKEREREKAKLEKMQMATGNSGATYDPFTRERAKQRSVGSFSDAEALNMEAPSPPVLEGGEKALKGFTHFYSPLSYTDLMERLQAATGTPETDVTNRVKATVPVGGAHVKVEVSVWSLGEVLLVDVQRREGDPILFHRVFKMIKSRVQAPELDAGLSELSVGVSAAGSEEEEMTDDVAMI